MALDHSNSSSLEQLALKGLRENVQNEYIRRCESSRCDGWKQLKCCIDSCSFVYLLSRSCSEFASQVFDAERHHSKPLKITVYTQLAMHTVAGHNESTDL